MTSTAAAGTGSTVPPTAPPTVTPIGRTHGEEPVRRARHDDETPAQGLPPVMAAPPQPPPEPVVEPAAKPKRRPKASVRKSPRRARLYVYRVDAWSVMKVAFMLSVALAVLLVTAVAVTWWLLDYSGVFTTLARNVDEVIGSGTTTFDLEAVLAFDRVIGITVVVAALEIALVSILAGIFAVLYNLTVGITGGVELTFTDAV